ncbi:MAG: von Willebrand factor type A domain-containing protein, partial [Planctomycetota bacterium]|nr:von Willebrand factor type A domain-containing protein [Planctomycetota bacterium]
PAPAAPAKPNAGLFPTGGATPAPAPEVSSAWVPSDGGTDSGADVSKVVTKERAGEGEATGKFDSRSGGGRKLVVKRGGGIPAKEESAPAETPATAVELPEVLDNKVLPARHDGNIAIAAGTVPFDAEKKTDEGRKEQLRELAGKARQAAEAARQPDLKSLLSKLDDAQDQGKAVATPPPPPPPADAALTDEDIYGRSGEDAGAIAVPARGDLTRDMDGMIRVSDGRAESSERVHVAIAAKDVAIRKQAELVAKERDADLKSATELATLKNEPENEELQREVRRHADDLKKLKGVVLKQQQAVVQEETEKSLEQAREHSIRPPARLKANDGKLNVNSADELLLDNLVSQPDNTPAEPTPGEARDITVPPDVLAKAELGDHFETVNPDRPDTKSAFGNPVTSEYLFSRGKDAGGGGQGGKELDDLFSKVGAAASGGIFSGLLRSRMAANNTAAAASCKAFAEAEEIYHRTDYNADGVLEYAQSLKGKNSLLEKTPGAGDMALVDRSFAAAEGPPSARPTPKAGYCFKVLTGQGPHAPGGARSYLDSAGHMTLGYALVAYPAKYDGTGRDCYIINNNGTTYQADLGPKTHAIVERMTAFDPDPRIWTIEEGGTAPQSTEAAPPQSAAVPAQTKVPRVGALFKPAEDKAIAEAGHLEQLLRGYRYFRADNEKLRLRDFLRRPAPVPPAVLTDEGLDEDLYIERYGTRPFVDCARDHLSTFGLDVDTASYTRARSQLRENKLPEADTVRVEEFLNYFKQPYEVTGDDAFGVFAEGMPAPFCSTGVSPVPMAETAMVRSTGQEARATVELLKIGIKSRDARPDERKPAMLTFVVDTSGSMNRDNRLGLAQAALRALVEDLSPEDAVSIVGFSDQAELALPRTQARQKQRILDAIDSLTPHGATNVEAGLNMGYRLADECYSPDAVNRMILCSDGVANVGAKGPEEMLKLVKVFADRGIDLSAVGFGKGAYNDQMMSRLADNGNGSCYFVDKAEEAQRVFREQLPPHLNVLARDAKAQVEFNPDVVARYRLLGYEKRKIADKDFRNDKIDAGEVAHSTLITVMYEITRKPGSHGPLGKVFLRWKDAGYRHLPVVERNYPLSEGVMAGDVRAASPELRFLACVARFAELLRGSPWVRDGSYAAVLEQLRQLPPDFQEREDWREVCRLVACAQELSVKRWLQEIQ